MVLMESLIGLEGCRIRFTTNEGPYEGTISSIKHAIELLMIRNVIWLPKNSKLGTLAFRSCEIKKFKIIETSQTSKPDFAHFTRGYQQNCRKHTLADEFPDYVIDNEFFDICREKEYELRLPSNLVDVLPIDYDIIDCLESDFFLAIKHIKKQDAIGVSLESPNIIRYEKLHWLCISSVCCTFLFDIMKLGKDAFNKGLRSILQDPLILKIIHDCREMSDCLYHQFDTRLVNVFDTQVADFIINMQRRKKETDYHARPLNSCLSQYLNVPDEFLYRRKRRSYDDNLVFFRLRPLINEFKDLFIKNVIYLKALRKQLDSLIMEPLYECSDVYRDSLRNKNEEELKLGLYHLNTLPYEFLVSDIQMSYFEKYVQIPTIVSSGPPYRRIESIFNDFFDYFEKYKTEGTSDEDESKRMADFDDITASENKSIAIVDGNTKFCDSNTEDSSNVDLDNEDPWAKLRKEFADVRPKGLEIKYKLIPAGME